MLELRIRVRIRVRVKVMAVASLGLVSLGAATDVCHPIFSGKKI